MHRPVVVGEVEAGVGGRGRSAFTAVEKKPVIEAMMKPGVVYCRAVGARQSAAGLRGHRSLVFELREQPDGKLIAEVVEMGPLETLADAQRRGEAMLRMALKPKPVRLDRG